MEAVRALLLAGFELRVTVPFHSAAILYPKIVKQTLEIIEDAAISLRIDNNVLARLKSFGERHVARIIGILRERMLGDLKASR